MGITDWFRPRPAASKAAKEEEKLTSSSDPPSKRCLDEDDAPTDAVAATSSDATNEAAQEEKDTRLFEQLEARFRDPTFLARLERTTPDASPSPEEQPDDPVPDDASENSYVMVSQDDVVEALAHAIATCVLSCPEAQDMSPHELQKAILNAFKELKQSKAKSAWGWFWFIYRAGSWTYSAFSLYANPWLLRAIILAFWSVPQFLGRFFFF